MAKPQPCPGTACSRSSVGLTLPHRTAPASTPCTGCMLCRLAGHCGSTSSLVSLSPAAGRGLEAPAWQQWGAAEPRSPAEIHSSAVLARPSPTDKPSCHLAMTSLAALGRMPALPHPLSLGAKREQLLPSTDSPPSPDTAAESKVCSRPSQCTGMLPPLKPAHQPLCSPRLAPLGWWCGPPTLSQLRAPRWQGSRARHAGWAGPHTACTAGSRLHAHPRTGALGKA